MLRGLFIIGCLILMGVCALGFAGIITMPEEYYAYFWGGFMMVAGLIRGLMRIRFFARFFGGE